MIRFVLCRPQHPGNIGSAARAIKTMGFSDLRLVAPERYPAPEAQWMATHAVEQLKGLLGSCVVRPGGAPPEGTQMVPEWGKP